MDKQTALKTTSLVEVIRILFWSTNKSYRKLVNVNSFHWCIAFLSPSSSKFISGAVCIWFVVMKRVEEHMTHLRLRCNSCMKPFTPKKELLEMWDISNNWSFYQFTISVTSIFVTDTSLTDSEHEYIKELVHKVIPGPLVAHIKRHQKPSAQLSLHWIW